MNQGKAQPPENLFVVMSAVATLQILCLIPCAHAQEPYWAFVPDPPLFHPVTRNYEKVKLVTNGSLFMGIWFCSTPFNRAL